MKNLIHNTKESDTVKGISRTHILLQFFLETTFQIYSMIALLDSVKEYRELNDIEQSLYDILNN